METRCRRFRLENPQPGKTLKGQGAWGAITKHFNPSACRDRRETTSPDTYRGAHGKGGFGLERSGTGCQTFARGQSWLNRESPAFRRGECQESSGANQGVATFLWRYPGGSARGPFSTESFWSAKYSTNLKSNISPRLPRGQSRSYTLSLISPPRLPRARQGQRNATKAFRTARAVPLPADHPRRTARG